MHAILSQVPLAENLADLLLQPKAAQRMSAEQALRHRYFAELPPAIHDLGDGESTGSSKINGAKLSDACSVRANWLCMGWPFCLAEMRREFQTGGNFFCTTLYFVEISI